MGALSHGLIMLYLGGRMGLPPAYFRDLYRRSFKRTSVAFASDTRRREDAFLGRFGKNLHTC